MSRLFIGWSNANAEVYRCAMEAVNGRENSAPSLLWQLQKHLPENRIKLKGHILSTTYGTDRPHEKCPLWRNIGRTMYIVHYAEDLVDPAKTGLTHLLQCAGISILLSVVR